MARKGALKYKNKMQKRCLFFFSYNLVLSGLMLSLDSFVGVFIFFFFLSR